MISETQLNSTTADVIESMMKENTGKHMLDSGSAYGRHWEANQDRDFRAEDAVSVDIYEDGEVIPTINLFFYLLSKLEYYEQLDEQLSKHCKENQSQSHLQCMETFAQQKGWSGLYGDGDPMTINTYNEESALSQTIQYVYGESSEKKEAYVLLQVHNGCDVRGGYTAPRAFRCAVEGASFLTDHKKLDCGCSNGHRWFTDDTYHWHGEKMSDKGLREYHEEGLVSTKEDADDDALENHLIVDPDSGTMWCPECDLRDGGLIDDTELKFQAFI